MVKKSLAVLVLALFTSSCGSDFGGKFSFDRDVPDEFSVTRRASLTRPPDLYLRPPRTETRREDVQVEGVIEIITGVERSREKEENFEGSLALKFFLREVGVFDEIPFDLRSLLDEERKDRLDAVSDETVKEILKQ